jgi:hypothetical protein
MSGSADVGQPRHSPAYQKIGSHSINNFLDKGMYFPENFKNTLG